MRNHLKFIIILALGFIGFCVVSLMGCETSEGTKFGLLQKVSHKSGLCDYFVIEIAYAGGRKSDEGYENTQCIQTSKQGFDSLQKYVGFYVAFDYSDEGILVGCGENKFLTSIRVVRPT